MSLAERPESRGEEETEKAKTLLPSPEAMKVYTWYTAIDDAATDFAERLAELKGQPEKADELLKRDFNGYGYKWTFTERRPVEGKQVETKVELQLRPDHLLRGPEAFIGGFSQTNIIKPESGEPGFGIGGPQLLDLQGSLDASPKKRAKIVSQIKKYMPHAWQVGHQDAQELPAAERRIKQQG